MTELLPFQKDGVRAIYKLKGRALLADEQGLGKTIQSLDWIRRLKQARPVLVVCPASVKYTWQDEAAKHFNMRMAVIEGNRPKRTMTLPSKMVIINYDILNSWMPALLRNQCAVLIMDEVQYIKNHETLRARACHRLSEGARSVVGLSGTPFTNECIELWSVLQAIRPDVFPERSAFAWRYTRPMRYRGIWHFKGSKREGELHRILTETVMIRRLKKDVAPQLPSKRRKIVRFKLTKHGEYKKAEDDFRGWLHAISPAKAKRARRAEAMLKVGYLLRLAAKLKRNWVKRWINDFIENNPGQKLCCFSMHTDTIEYFADVFRGRCVVINGAVTGIKRHEAVRKFQNNRKIVLMFGNWKAAGVGLTLTAASNIAALDIPFTPGDMKQAEDRIHRIGQKMKCIIYYLLAMNTREEVQVATLKRKDKVLAAIIDGAKKTKSLDMFDEIIKSLK